MLPTIHIQTGTVRGLSLPTWIPHPRPILPHVWNLAKDHNQGWRSGPYSNCTVASARVSFRMRSLGPPSPPPRTLPRLCSPVKTRHCGESLIAENWGK